MRLFRPFFIVRWLFPEAVIRVKTTEKILYLTFDDGPDPGSTPEILGILNKFNIRAVFFCNGKKAEKYPDLMGLIKSGGHIIGNHGYYHLSGWNTSSGKYAADIEKAASFTSSSLFRPPYGRLRKSQYLRLKKKFKIILWDLMPYDFDKSFGAGNVLDILKNKVRKGTVIVLHDTSISVARDILNEFIGYSLQEGYRFDILPE